MMNTGTSAAAVFGGAGRGESGIPGDDLRRNVFAEASTLGELKEACVFLLPSAGFTGSPIDSKNSLSLFGLLGGGTGGGGGFASSEIGPAGGGGGFDSPEIGSAGGKGGFDSSEIGSAGGGGGFASFSKLGTAGGRGGFAWAATGGGAGGGGAFTLLVARGGGPGGGGGRGESSGMGASGCGLCSF